MIGDFGSFMSGVLLLVSGCRVMWAYRPRSDWRQTAAGILGFAIFLSFFGAVANTVYWQVWGQFAVEYLQVWTAAVLRFWGDYTDIFAKGCVIAAAELHLMAIRKKEREK